MSETLGKMHDIISYRLSAVDALALACRLKMGWSAAVPIQVWFDGKLTIDGLSTAYTNPVIESGVIHARALLEFLGLTTEPKNHQRLAQRMQRRADDWGIESFSVGNQPLRLVTPAETVVGYTGPSEEAERAFAYVIHLANKGIAHHSSGLIIDAEDDALLELAARGIPVLFRRHFYEPLGLEVPPSHVRLKERAAT